MASPSMAPIPVVSSSTLRWSRVVCWSALYSALCTIGLFFDYSLHDHKPVSGLWGLFLFCMFSVSVMSIFWLPCLLAFNRVRGERPKKSGLALAVGMGGVQFFLAGVALSATHAWDANWGIQCLLALGVVAQPVMIAAAIGTYYTLPRERWDRRKLLASCTYALGLFVLMAIAIPDIRLSPIPGNESSTVARMRTMQTAASSYADQFGVYPSDLAALGAPDHGQKADCRKSNLLDQGFDENKNGYRIEYKEGVLSEKATGGCAGAKAYTITARPVVFGKTGLQNYFMDESGVLRATDQDRAATATDPQI